MVTYAMNETKQDNMRKKSVIILDQLITKGLSEGKPSDLDLMGEGVSFKADEKANAKALKS